MYAELNKDEESKNLHAKAAKIEAEKSPVNTIKKLENDLK